MAVPAIRGTTYASASSLLLWDLPLNGCSSSRIGPLTTLHHSKTDSPCISSGKYAYILCREDVHVQCLYARVAPVQLCLSAFRELGWRGGSSICGKAGRIKSGSHMGRGGRTGAKKREWKGRYASWEREPLRTAFCRAGFRFFTCAMRAHNCTGHTDIGGARLAIRHGVASDSVFLWINR